MNKADSRKTNKYSICNFIIRDYDNYDNKFNCIIVWGHFYWKYVRVKSYTHKYIQCVHWLPPVSALTVDWLHGCQMLVHCLHFSGVLILWRLVLTMIQYRNNISDSLVFRGSFYNIWWLICSMSYFHSEGAGRKWRLRGNIMFSPFRLAKQMYDKFCHFAVFLSGTRREGKYHMTQISHRFYIISLS
jgi:hypothetical protein